MQRDGAGTALAVIPAGLALLAIGLLLGFVASPFLLAVAVIGIVLVVVGLLSAGRRAAETR